jgi:hypothetical protein
MLLRTSTRTAPWTLIEGNDKLWARVRVLEKLVEVLSAELDHTPADPLKNEGNVKPLAAAKKAAPAKKAGAKKTTRPAGR